MPKLPSSKSFLATFMCACLLLCLAARQAEAFLSSENIPKLNRKVEMSREEFYSLSEDVKDDPLNDSSLAFEIRLPKNWIKLPSPDNVVKLGAGFFQDLSVFIGPARGDIRSRIQIRSLGIKNMISAEDWFLSYILSSGSTVDGLHIKSRKKFEAQYTLIDNGQSYVVRAAGEITGSRVVLAEYLVPIEYAEKEQAQQIWTIATFRLTSPDPSPIEPVDTYTFVDIMKFNYPQSWILNSPPITTIDRMDASIVNLKGVNRDNIRTMELDRFKLDGRVDVDVISKDIGTSAAQELDYLDKELAARNLEVGDLIKEITDVKINKALLSSKINAYKIKSKDPKLARYELWRAVMESKGRYYIVSMLSVGREENYDIWSQNVAVFRYVLETLSPVNDIN